MATLYLCGAGNSEGVRLATTVNRARPHFDRMLLLDDDPTKHGRRLLDVEVAGPFEALADADPATAAVVNLVARTTRGRAAARARIAGYGIPFASLVHPGVDTEWSELAGDVLVYENAVVAPETIVGAGCVVFMRAIVGHESQLGPGCVIAAGAVLNARVVLGEGVYVGSNASILPEVRVGAGATIGANSLVIADVPAGATVVGVPGQVVSVPEAAPAVCQASPPPDTGRERQIAALWSEVLGKDVEQATVNFCHLGGTSLLALRVLELLRRRYDIAVAVADFYRFPTVRSFAAHLAGSDDGASVRTAQARGALRRSRLLRASLPD